MPRRPRQGRTRRSGTRSSPGWRDAGPSGVTSDGERGVFAAEGDTVGDGVLEVEFASGAGDVVQIALGRGLGEVDGGVNNPIAHGKQDGGDTGGAAGSLGMAEQALEGAAGDAIGVFAEGEFDGGGFDAVVQFGRGAVVLQVADVFGGDAGFVESHLNGPGGFFTALFEADAVVGLAGGTVADELSVDAGAAGEGAFAFLDGEEPGAFGEDEAVAVGGEGPGAAFGVIVPALGHDAHELEATEDEGGDGGVGAAGDNAVDHAGLDHAHGVAEGVGGRGAARGNDVGEAAEAEVHGDFAGEGADGRGRNHIDGAVLELAGEIETVLFLGEGLAAAAGADDDGNLSKLVAGEGSGVEAGIGECLGGGGAGERGDAADVGAFLGVGPLVFIEAGDLACDAYGEWGGVEVRDDADAAFAGERIAPELLAPDAIRAHGADAGDDNASAVCCGGENRHECASIGVF
jgi:hypothetical protein